ncbi:MAG: hypothetical protein N2423_00720 [Novosphingobium sp.]|nr:hypothetical protein [Novosphingobium sp.]
MSGEPADSIGHILIFVLLVILALGVVMRARRNRDPGRGDLSGVPAKMQSQAPCVLSCAEITSRLGQQPEVLNRLDPRAAREIGEAIAANRKLEAIRLLRAATRLSLHQAKEVIERIS